MTDPFLAEAPLEALERDRTLAHEAGDPNAGLGWVATADPDGNPSVRTLVLRRVDDHWALFVNATSAKWADLATRPRCQVAVWLATVQRQWRLDARVRPLPRSLLEHHWPHRPRVARVMDHVYAERHPQGSPIEHPDVLAAAHAELDARLPESEQPPADALALALDIHHVECLQIAPPPELHRRRSWQRRDPAGGIDAGEQWVAEERVP